MSEYTVYKQYKNSLEPQKSFKDLGEALLSCIHYDSLCQDSALATVIIDADGDRIFSIDQHGFYNAGDGVNKYELKVISDFVKQLEDR